MSAPEPPEFIDIGEAGGLSARINRHGAELWRLSDHDGVDLLWSGDPQVWAGRAPILFPIIGSLAGGIYRYGGASYPLHRHGFARHGMFAVVEHRADQAVLRLEATADSRKVYPFAFRLDLRFTCADAALTVAVEVSNLGGEPMPFSFGFHPALRWPLEPGASRADHAITFAEPEPAPISKLDADGLILPEREPSPVVGRRLELHDELFAADALVFTDIASRSIEYGAASHDARHIRLEFENLPLLGVWTKPGAGYICIEPWQGMADPEGFADDIFAKPGIIGLAPHASWQAQMMLSPEAPR